jgi:hypothetical protein
MNGDRLFLEPAESMVSLGLEASTIILPQKMYLAWQSVSR